MIDGEPCLLDILDTAGQVEFTAMREQYMRGGEGFIICYSVADKHSFLEAEEYRNLILKVRLFHRKLKVSLHLRGHSQMMFAPRERARGGLPQKQTYIVRKVARILYSK